MTDLTAPVVRRSVCLGQSGGVVHVARSLLAVVAALLAACGLVVLLGGPAAAHAGLADSTPRDGDSVATLPSAVDLTFTEDVSSPAFVVVRDAAGVAVSDGDPTIDGAVVTQTLATADAQPGVYTLAYRVVSSDGHPVSGELTFTVESAAPEPTPAPTAEPTPDPTADPTAVPTPEATDADAAPAAADTGDGFWATHGATLLLGLGVLVVVATLVAAAVRRRAG